MQHTTKSSQKILAALTASLFVSGTAMAADPVTYIKIDDVRESVGDPIGSIAIGINGTSAKNQSSIAVGTGVSADGNGAIAVGSYANAIGTAATAVGQGTKASEQSAAAFGQKAQATAGASTAVGSGTVASDQSAAAFGAGATASARNAAAIAANAKAEGINSVAIGQKALAQNSGSTAVGTGSQATQGASSAFGSGALATGAGATALGQGTQASGSNTVAIGQKSHASGTTATAIGSGSEASGTNSIANGTSAKATSNFTIATGNKATASATNAIATGNAAKATGVNAIATGSGAQATGAFTIASGLTAQADGNQAIAIGRKAVAANDFSVALGSFATTEAAVGTKEATVNGITYSGFAGDTPTGTVSVGNAEQKRTITNVAAGRIDATSTDAINGSQLYLVANELKNAATVITSEDGSVIVNAPTTNDQGGNVYNLSVKTDKTTITNEGGVIKANTAALADADKDGKIDAPSTDDGKKLITAGDVANAINASGFTAKANGDAGELVNPGEAIDFINGKNIEITRDGSNFTVATAKDVTFDSVTFGDNGPKITNNGGNINVAGNDGSPTKITGVKAGEADTDAVNVSQLKAAKTEVVAGDNVIVSAPSTNPATGATQYTVSANSSSTAAGSDYVTVTPSTTTGANGATNTTYAVDLSDKTKAAIQNMVNIDNRLDDMEDDLRAGIAGATAIAFLQRPNEAGKSIVSAAVGGFRDQQALAIGYARNSDNNKWSIKAGVGINTRKDVNWGGSIGYQW